MSSSETGSVKLRTGIEASQGLVAAVSIALRRLGDENPIALLEAVEMARDSSHAPFGRTGEALRGYSLIDVSGQMHGAVRDVILAATDGDGFDIHLVSPYAEDVAQ